MAPTLGFESLISRIAPPPTLSGAWLLSEWDMRGFFEGVHSMGLRGLELGSLDSVLSTCICKPQCELSVLHSSGMQICEAGHATAGLRPQLHGAHSRRCEHGCVRTRHGAHSDSAVNVPCLYVFTGNLSLRAGPTYASHTETCTCTNAC